MPKVSAMALSTHRTGRVRGMVQFMNRLLTGA